MINLRTGIDLVEVSRLTDIKPSLRERFLARVFTYRELEQVGQSDTSLAGRFAAKEAVSKTLGCGIGVVSWQDIEILRGQQGEPVLTLTGKARSLADELGLTQWSLSISHTKTHAVAVAIAIGFPAGNDGAALTGSAIVSDGTTMPGGGDSHHENIGCC
jgi:holo-[acyl-carrier protein] synthase